MLITWEKMAENNITLREMLKVDHHCANAMALFGIKNYVVIESIIKKMGISASCLYKGVPYDNGGKYPFIGNDMVTIRVQRHNETCMRPHYVGINQYASITWAKIIEELFKKYYPQFYKAFSYSKFIALDKNSLLSEVYYNDSLSKMSLKQIRSAISKGGYEVEKSHFAFYDNSEFVFLNIPNTEHSVYLKFEDLLRIRKGESVESVWDNIKNRKWYFDRVQKDEEWWQNEYVTSIKNALFELSQTFKK